MNELRTTITHSATRTFLTTAFSYAAIMVLIGIMVFGIPYLLIPLF